MFFLGIFNYAHLLTFQDITATDENFEEYLQLSRSCYEKDRFALIYDISKMRYLPSKYRIIQGNDLEASKYLIEEKSMGLAIIAPTIIQQLIVKGILLIKPYPSKLKVCSTMEEAMKWINDLLENENIENAK
jgi:hypothetical protein